MTVPLHRKRRPAGEEGTGSDERAPPTPLHRRVRCVRTPPHGMGVRTGAHPVNDELAYHAPVKQKGDMHYYDEDWEKLPVPRDRRWLSAQRRGPGPGCTPRPGIPGKSRHGSRP